MSKSKKDQILLAASECFAKYGYKKTTLDDIGKKIGLNKASIYYYFKNKEEIFTTIILNEFQQFITTLHLDIRENMKCEEKICLYFEEKLRYWFQKSLILPQITEIDAAERLLLMNSGKEIYIKIEQEEKLFLAKILQNCIKEGQIKECNVEKISELMFAMVDGIKDKLIELSQIKSSNTPNFENMIIDVRKTLKIFIVGLKFTNENME